MSLPRPSLELELDGQSFDGPSAALTRLSCTLGVDGSHDQLLFHVSLQSPLADVEQDVPVKLSLGNSDAPEGVFSGTVRSVERTARGVVVEAYADTWLMSQLFLAQAYLDMTIADIVSDLAGQAGVTTATLEAPVKLSAYHVDERRAAWSYARDLARFADLDLTTSADGELNLLPASGGGGAASASLTGTKFRYGAEVLSWQAGARTEPAAATGYAYGAGSEAGAEKWHVLLKDPGKSDGATRVLPIARDRDAASKWTAARANSAKRATLSGQALVIGSPALRAGSVVSFELPTGDIDARCRGVAHHLSASSGFVTALQLEGIA